eukprot:scaffold90_cov264-Pinguiococcus_pyrenoidosus.AAC.15
MVGIVQAVGLLQKRHDLCRPRFRIGNRLRLAALLPPCQVQLKQRIPDDRRNLRAVLHVVLPQRFQEEKQLVRVIHKQRKQVFNVLVKALPRLLRRPPPASSSFVDKALAEVHQEARRFRRSEAEQLPPMPLQEREALLRLQAGDVLERVVVVGLFTIELDVDVELVSARPVGQLQRMVVIAAAVEHLGRALDVKGAVLGVVLTLRRTSLLLPRFLDSGGQGEEPALLAVDERVELLDVLELGVAGQQQIGVLCDRVAQLMEPLQVHGEEIDPLGVQVAHDHVARVHMADRVQVLGHRVLEVALLAEMIPVSPVDVYDCSRIIVGVARKGDGDGEELLVQQDLKLVAGLLLAEPQKLHAAAEHPRRAAGADDGRDLLSQLEELMEGHELVLQVVDGDPRSLRAPLEAGDEDVPVQPLDPLLIPLEGSRPAAVLYGEEEDAVTSADDELPGEAMHVRAPVRAAAVIEGRAVVVALALGQRVRNHSVGSARGARPKPDLYALGPRALPHAILRRDQKELVMRWSRGAVGNDPRGVRFSGHRRGREVERGDWRRPRISEAAQRALTGLAQDLPSGA